MIGEKQGEKEFAVAYAQKFWDAGNLIVTLVFGLAFAVYVALAQYVELRYLVCRNIWLLVALSLVGNALLGVVLWRLYVHEKRVVELIIHDMTFVDAVKSAFHIRLGLLAGNTVMYLLIIFFVWVNLHVTNSPKQCPQVGTSVVTPNHSR